MAVPKRKTGRARTHARRSENPIVYAPIVASIAIVRLSRPLNARH